MNHTSPFGSSRTPTGVRCLHLRQSGSTQLHQLVGNNLTRTPFDQHVVYLNARCETKPNGTRQYFLFTETVNPPDFTLHPGESLILNLDGDVLSLAPTNTPSFQGRRRYTTTFYPVTQQQIEKLSLARQAHLRIKGTDRLIDKKLSERNLLRFAEFYGQCEADAVRSSGKTSQKKTIPRM